MEIPRDIYAIQHNITKKIYIGSSQNMVKRYKQHIYALRSGKHHVEDMQSDFIKYGEDYSLFKLETIRDYKDKNKEYEWMEKLESTNRSKGYNYKDNTTKDMHIPLKDGIPEIKT